MSEEQKKDIKEMVEILGDLDREDLLLIKGGATMLAAKKELERKQQSVRKGYGEKVEKSI